MLQQRYRCRCSGGKFDIGSLADHGKTPEASLEEVYKLTGVSRCVESCWGVLGKVQGLWK